MKVAEVRLPDEWEQWSCEMCPFSYVDLSRDDGFTDECVLGNSDGCPVTAKEKEEWER